MKLTLAIPIMNQLNDAKGPLGTFRYNTSDDAEWLIIDNGSTDPVEEFIREHLRPKRLNYIRNNENVGMVATMQQAYEECDSDILALTHNDVFIYEKDWDQRIVSYFENMPDLGAVGLFGSQGCGSFGGRIQDVPNMGVAAGVSNMLEAEVHGMRMAREFRPVSIFDGFFMAFRMEMLETGGGFDQRYHYHHIYDRDASLESLRRGYNNIVVNIPCHHMCGLTANRGEYQDWVSEKTKDARGEIHGDKWTHDENSKLFNEKWRDVLPLYVEDDFSFRTGYHLQWIFKGGSIRGFEPNG